MLNLETLVANLPGDTYMIDRPCQINNASEICETVEFTDGTSQAFLLIPND